jgi:cation diffusion facilitator CzcD-associated flavoprotein CzcO
MCFSDSPFPYGPFVPHYVARQYVENYFATHKLDTLLELNTTLEDLSWVPSSEERGGSQWKLTLRKYDPVRHVDIWWEDFFDAVVLANGHYSVPYV